jgi:tetraacyldisaccharide 4'-kinase
MARQGRSAGLPVVCVGNFILGGAGKTPAAIAIARMLTGAGERVFFLSRGYGGIDAGPRRVDPHSDSAAQVGDEPLLLAAVAPTIIARDRVAGANLAKEQGATVVVMDDGLQNPSPVKDVTFAVIDARRGIGNGKVFPAGPLRAPLGAQLARTDALLVVGTGTGADATIAAAQAYRLPVLRGRLVVDDHVAEGLKGRKVLAFAGIGDPEKFFVSAEELGIAIVKRRAFADHHRFSAEEAADLIMEAEHDGLALLTTEKDRARMTGDPLMAALAAKARTLPVTMTFSDEAALSRLMIEKLRR